MRKMGFASAGARLAAIAAACALYSAAAAAQTFTPPPAPTRWVTDTAGFLSEQTRRTLDARLERYEKDTGRQVIVWIGKSISRGELEDFTVRTAHAWGIGGKQDDGVVIFVFPLGGPGERHIRIEVGYGSEGALPDAFANRIVEDVMIPRLQAGQPDQALTAGVSAVLERLGGETSPPPRVAPVPQAPRAERRPSSPANLVCFGLIAVIFIILMITNPRLAMLLLFSMMSGGRGGFGGGRGGGFGGGGGGFRGGGGRFGGGGASGSW